MTLSLSSCHEKDKPHPIDNSVERTIVYTVGHDEQRTTLENDAEWDVLLEQFCNYAHDGLSVTFYNTSHIATPTNHSSKEATTITTTSQDELKEWMKKMEKEGKTVSISYDDKTKTWSGMAYANAPTASADAICHSGTVVLADITNVFQLPLSSQVVALQLSEDTVLILLKDSYMSTLPQDFSDEMAFGDTTTLCGKQKNDNVYESVHYIMFDITENASIEGRWHYSLMIETEVSYSHYDVISTTLYTPDEGQDIAYEFLPDGSLTRTVTGTNASVADGSWSLSNEGMLCCDLLTSDISCWYINWLTSSTMIISRSETTPQGTMVFYQMEFAKSN